MRVTTISDFHPAPGSVLEFTARPAAGAEFRPSPVPPSMNQRFHLDSARGSGLAPPWLAFTFDVPGELDAAALHEVFAEWIARHEALLSRFREQDGEVVRELLPADGVELQRREVGELPTTAAVREHFRRRFTAQCHPLGWPPFLLGAVRRAGSATVFGAFDHANADAYSIAVAAHEIQALYRERTAGIPADLPATGSFVDYCAREQADSAPPDPDEPALVCWREFLRGCGGTVPAFPLDLGVAPREPVPQRSETRQLLDARAADGFEAACRAGAGTPFTGVLAAFGLALHARGAEPRNRLLIPMHTRHQSRWWQAMGWFTTNAPIDFPVEPGDFGRTLESANAAFRRALETLDVPLHRVLGALAGEFGMVRKDVFMLSYVDYRELPLSLEFPGADAHHISSETDADDAQFWVSRNRDGMFLRSRFPGTARARETMADFHAAFAAALEEVAGSLVLR